MDGQPERQAVRFPVPGNREKYWKELSIEEKIERMREQVKMLQYRQKDIQEQMLWLKEHFRYHTHVDGRVTVDLITAQSPPYGDSKEPTSKNTDDGYF